MEKKTIGGFIAALRKVNGMTQKDLAEQLNVSDKTVSRWERDEGTPDLAVIPVIAEIFHVTCDELLRGERTSPAERMESPEHMETTTRGEKQRRYLLKSAFSQYQNLSLIAAGVSVVGLIGALICNLAFLKAALGFLLGAIFYTAGIISQVIFLNKAFSGIEDAELDEPSISDYRRKSIMLAEKSIGLTVLMTGFTFPMVLIEANLGLTWGGMLLWGTVSAVIFLAVYAVALYVVNGMLLNKGIFRFYGKAAEINNHNRILKKRCAIGFTITLIATMVFHLVGSSVIWSIDNLSKSRQLVFDDYESFVDFMEQDIPYEDWDYDYHVFGVEVENSANIGLDEQNQWPEEEFPMCTLEDANSNVVCTYTERNRSVCRISYTPQEGTVLPVYVLTNNGYHAAKGQYKGINMAYCFLYPIELLAVLMVYFKKRAR